MNYLELIGFIQIVLIATTPVVFAAIGELVTEKSGVLNLGVEGMMLVGAVTAFVTLVITGSYVLAFLFSIFAGIFMSGLFAFLVLIIISYLKPSYSISFIFIVKALLTLIVPFNNIIIHPLHA